MHHINKILKPPVFSSEDHSHAAELLNGILLGAMVIPAIFGLLDLLFAPAGQSHILAARSAFSFTGSAVLYALFRRRHIRLVRNAFLPVYYLLVSSTMDGISSNHSMTAATSVLIVCIAGLVMETKPLSFALAAVGLFSLWQGASEYHIFEAQGQVMQWFTEWGVFVSVMLSAGIVAHHANRRWVKVVRQADERRVALEKQNSDYKKELAARRLAEMRQAETASLFSSLTQASEELLKIEGMDQFWRRAVEIAREGLGIERCSIFLNPPGTRTYIGTYGTSLDGDTMEEGHIHFESDELAEFSRASELHVDRRPWQRSTYASAERASAVHEWTISTPIFTDHGKRAYGIMFNDNARTGNMEDPAQQDALAVYCSMLATIIERRELISQQESLLESLRAVLGGAAPLLQAGTIDELWKAAVEFTRKDLEIERAAIFVRDPNTGLVHGTYGTDFSGRTTEEHELILKPDGPMMTEIRSLNGSGDFHAGRHFVIEADQKYYDKNDSRVRVSGTGWLAITPILAHTGEPSAWMSNDAALSRSPLDPNRQEVLAVFCSLLGNIAERKRLEESFRRLNATLETKVNERTEQLNERNLDLSNQVAERKQAERVLEQRIKYEKLIAELSNEFMRLPAESVSTGIDFALRRIGEVTGVEIVRLLMMADDGNSLYNPNEWTAPGIPSEKEALQNYQAEGLQSWWAVELMINRVIYAPDLSSPPSQYAGQPVIESIAARGVKSMLTVPVTNDSEMRGALCLDMISTPLTWSAENIQMIQVVAEMIAKALDREKLAQANAARAAMDRLLSGIARDLNRTYPEEIDAAIVRSLAQVGEFLNVDACRLFEYPEQGGKLCCVAAWLSPLGKARAQTELAEYESWPWWRDTIHRHGVVVIPDVSKLVEEDQKQAFDYLISRGIKAALSAPVVRDDEIMGEIGIDVLTSPRPWHSQDLYLLRIATELIVHARDRRRTANLLKQERDSLEERVMNRTRVLSNVLDITQTVSSTQTMEALLALVINRFKAAIPCDAVLLSELVRRDGDTRIFQPLKSEAGLAQDNRASELLYEPRVDVDLTASFDNRRPFIIQNTQAASPYAAAFRARFVRHLPGSALAPRSVMHAPMIVEDQVVGVMTVLSSQVGHFTENEAAIAMAFANQTAALLMRTRLRDRDVYAAALTERSRLARELHDSVSQALFGIVLGSKTVLGIIGASKVPEQDILRDPIQYIYGLSEAALSEMRALIFELRPESLQTEGIIMAFEKQAEMVFARHKIKVRTELGRVEPELPLNVKEALYRIGSEALQNTIKHAHASVIDIRLAVRQDSVLLDIIDDGAGFDTQAKFKGHYGLHTMRERAIQFRGTVEFESAPQQGTRVRVQFPLKHTGMLSAHPAGQQLSPVAA